MRGRLRKFSHLIFDIYFEKNVKRTIPEIDFDDENYVCWDTRWKDHIRACILRMPTLYLEYMNSTESMKKSHWSPDIKKAIMDELYDRAIFKEVVLHGPN